jgi:hypothetical protein
MTDGTPGMITIVMRAALLDMTRWPAGSIFVLLPAERMRMCRTAVAKGTARFGEAVAALPADVLPRWAVPTAASRLDTVAGVEKRIG